MINSYGCTPDDGKPCIAIPVSAEPIASMLSMANDLTAKALDMTLHISSQVLGSPMPDMNTKDPMCIPLYKARGLRWHDPAAEQQYQMERKGYKIRNLGRKQYWMDGDRVVEEVLKSE